MENNQRQYQERDVATLKVLGIFFSVMGALIFVATYEAIGNTPAVIVSICSGIVLSSIGAGMIFASRRLSKR